MNRLNTKAQMRVLRCLLEGNSIRSTARIVGVSKTTVLKLLVDTGKVCQDYQKEVMKNLECKDIQVDEIWSFIYSKKKNTKGIVGKGDSWTWVAICSESKIIPCWYVGDRTTESANIFIKSLSDCLSGTCQITTDGLKAYHEAVTSHMPEADFAMLVKHYVKNKSGGKLVIYKNHIQGSPREELISTSYIERQNLNIRMGIRRFTRKTNAFSKKVENHISALSLYFYYYNFIRKHKTLKTTPANAKGICGEKDLEEILRMAS